MTFVRVRLRWWESALLALPLLFAALLFVVGHVAVGTVVLALCVLTAASRAEVVEREVAGDYARTKSWLEAARWVSLFAIYAVVVALFIAMAFEHWTRDRHGQVAMWALTGFAVLLVREVVRVGDSSNRWWVGGDMEARVGAVIDSFRDEGWQVSHNLKTDTGGNVDHFVQLPGRCAFVIETKSGKQRAAARGQAIANAVWAKEKFGLRWVTGVLCVGEEPPTVPEKHGHCWVVGLDQLKPFLAAQARTRN